MAGPLDPLSHRNRCCGRGGQVGSGVVSLVCIFCRQPVYLTEQTEGAYGRMFHMRGKYRHIEGDEHNCDPAKIAPDAPKPRCHVCKVQMPPHHGYCSFRGMPHHNARLAEIESE